MVRCRPTVPPWCMGRSDGGAAYRTRASTPLCRCPRVVHLRTGSGYYYFQNWNFYYRCTTTAELLPRKLLPLTRNYCRKAYVRWIAVMRQHSNTRPKRLIQSAATCSPRSSRPAARHSVRPPAGHLRHLSRPSFHSRTPSRPPVSTHVRAEFSCSTSASNRFCSTAGHATEVPGSCAPRPTATRPATSILHIVLHGSGAARRRRS